MEQMPIEKYYQWLEELTCSGDTINGVGPQEWIKDYAEKRVNEAVVQIHSQACDAPITGEWVGFKKYIK